MSKGRDFPVYCRSRGSMIISLLGLSAVVIYSMYMLESSYGLFATKKNTAKDVDSKYIGLHNISSAKLENLICPCNLKYNDTSTSPFVFESDVLPIDTCCRPSVGNGYLATQLYSDTIHMNGFYNGHLGDSHRARIPSSVASIRYTPDKSIHVTKERFSLDVMQGTFFHTIEAKEVTIEQRVYAHQNLSRILVSEISIERAAGYSNSITLKLTSTPGPASEDINMKTGNSPFPGINYMYGQTKESETDTSGNLPIHIYSSKMISSVTLPANQNSQTWTFITSLSNSSTDAMSYLKQSLKMISTGQLHATHKEAWMKKWDGGRMDIDNNLKLSKAIYGSMYYILSSLPPIEQEGHTSFDFYGLSPGALAHGGKNEGYRGHVFWDQETWMYPTMLMFHPKLAFRMLKSRSMHLQAAANLAKSRGHLGVQFPWEMAYSGYEVCPAKIYAMNELHINGDIALATQQYLSLTNDTIFLLQHGGWEMVYGLAEFWSGLAQYDKTKDVYNINHVMPPDEYHQSVNNSVYTNAIAQITLRLPCFASKLIGDKKVPPEWVTIADKLVMVYDKELKYHPEYEGYTIGTKVKQADTILLGFPLLYNMLTEIRQHDLEIYDVYNDVNVTDPFGPAMTWGMFAIGWLELGNTEKAEEVFGRSFANIQEPFKIWTEVATGSGAINFITGMGGFLQTMLFGYGGFRIRQTSLDFNFQLPPPSTQLNITGVDYQRNEINFMVTQDSVLVNITYAMPTAAQLVIDVGAKVYSLKPGVPVTIPRMPGILRPVMATKNMFSC